MTEREIDIESQLNELNIANCTGQVKKYNEPKDDYTFYSLDGIKSKNKSDKKKALCYEMYTKNGGRAYYILADGASLYDPLKAKNNSGYNQLFSFKKVTEKVFRFYIGYISKNSETYLKKHHLSQAERLL